MCRLLILALKVCLNSCINQSQWTALALVSNYYSCWWRWLDNCDSSVRAARACVQLLWDPLTQWPEHFTCSHRSHLMTFPRSPVLWRAPSRCLTVSTCLRYDIDYNSRWRSGVCWCQVCVHVQWCVYMYRDWVTCPMWVFPRMSLVQCQSNRGAIC